MTFFTDRAAPGAAFLTDRAAAGAAFLADRAALDAFLADRAATGFVFLADAFLAFVADLFAAVFLAAVFVAERRLAGVAFARAVFRAFLGAFTERPRAAFFALRLVALRAVALRADLLFAMANPFRLKSRVPTI